MIADTRTALATGTYTIDAARSQVRFAATHSFGLGPVAGTVAVLDGTISVAADPAGCAVTARVDAASFTTDKPKRDKDIRSKRFLHTEQYPDMVFASDRLTADGDRWLLHGSLTIRGTTVPTTLEISGTAGADGCRFQAKTRIDRYAYRVGPRGIIGRYLDVELDVVGSPTNGRADH
jgi:polyisoprenoid-binding protein YceI